MNQFILCLGVALVLVPTSTPVLSDAPALTAPTPPLAAPVVPAEVRGMWVVRSSITTPDAIEHVVDNARSHHFNTLFVQVRGRGDAMYRSSLEPRAKDLAGQPVDFDPLGTILTRAHAAGIAVHAWVDCCYIWGEEDRPDDPTHIVNAHPDWLARDSCGQVTFGRSKECEGVFMTPSNPAACRHLRDVILEIVRNYDIDGVHLDYIRYPNERYDYSHAALAAFQAAMVGQTSPSMRASLYRAQKVDRLAYPHMFPNEYDDFRRGQITDLVCDISRDVKAAKPWVVMSAAVFADYNDAYVRRGQDWKEWLRRGALDAVVPMAYGDSTALVSEQVAGAVDAAHAAGRMAFAGIGAWHISAASTVAKIEAARTLDADGEVLFSYGGMTRDGATNGYLDKVESACYPGPAAPPPMPWLGSRTAASPSPPGDTATIGTRG
ncbi:MAG: glycoside hydrolase family 10 protein [Capsulimonadaceae bacterium]